ncbi:MAG: DUF3592 domain-containing protein [Anaerolineales bacterium]|nr:DUF3592 domain-containing protein [Anaerolineales bacterium]
MALGAGNGHHRFLPSGVGECQEKKSIVLSSVGAKYVYGNGQALVCERFAFNDHLISTSTKKDAEDRIKSYQVGQTVQVYYDPNDPQKSVLEPGNISPSMSSLVGAVIFFGLALLQFVLAFLAIK